ncbi:MAG: S8 family serine peptidase [Acidobacteriota bacterium]|nr:S8 family serine peptidase [Acidobacteriota bacterium]
MTRRDARWISAVLILAVAPMMAPAGSAEDEYRLRFGEHLFDPLEETPELQTGWDRSHPTRPDLHLVQLHGPTTDQTLELVRGSGLEVVQYIYPKTYIVWGGRPQRDSLAGHPEIRWTGDFAPAFRVQPQWRNLQEDAVDVRVLMYRGADTNDIVRAILLLGGRLDDRKIIDDRFETAGFVLPGSRMQAVAKIPGIYSVRRVPTDGGLRTEMTGQINVNNVDGTGLAFPGYLNWLNGVGLSGAGAIIANVDGGIQDTHPDLVNRMLACTGTTCGTTQSSHGTHTAGIMAADGSSGTLDAFGFLRGLGVAPGANLIEQNYSPTFTSPGGMLTLMTDSVRNGAVLSGNSWGPSGSPQGYDDDTMQVDIGVRDADPGLPGNQPFTYVLSFMNGYGGTSSQGSPDEAKNLFNIGSTKAQNGDGSQILDIDDLSSNSAHGPALDGRTIPHMVAPGCSVDSTDTTASTYGLKCGTSMASPQVSGGVALFFEYYRGLPDTTNDPSPALVKAAFLAVARSLAGNLDADGGTLGHPFDSKQGWGRMDLEAVIDPPPFSVRYFDNPQVFDDSGEEWTQTLSPLDPAQPVRIMLVWTDAPGHGLGGSTPAWNNDLDLVVDTPGGSYLGNTFGGDGFSTTGGTADLMNNTEGVFLGPTPPSDFTVRVLASNINSDAVPGVGDATDQDFALVCYNCAVEPGFTLVVDERNQTSCAPADATWDLEVREVLGFADPVTLSVSGEPAGTTASFSVNPVTPTGLTTLTVSNTAGGAAGEYTLDIDAVSGSISRSATVDLRLDTGLPLSVTAVSPADGSIDVSTTPTLEWSVAAQTLDYVVEVATDPGFADVVYSRTVAETTHVVETALDTVTTHYWRVRGINGCGAGAFSTASSFTTLDTPPLLLVDDDDNNPDVRGYYTDVLEALGIPYDVWDTANSDNEPTSATLSSYEMVVWFTGDEFGGVSGPGSAGETALATWLDGLGCLLIASQDYHWDRSLTAFMQSHLGVASVDNDVSQTTATGTGGVFTGLGPYTLSYPYTNYSDTLNPDATAVTVFTGSAGDSGVAKDTGLYRSSFWGFGLETLPTESDREDTISMFVQWCDDLALQDGDTDGTTNGDDCSPADPDVWSAPSPARDLFVATSTTDNITWNPPATPGALVVTYDVLRSTSADFTVAVCIESDGIDTVATDATDPLPGEIWFYAIRASNGCGSTLGADTSGEPRPASSCP